MPLFMDFHKIDNVTIEAVKSAHIADLSIQERYGVRYIQFWVNEDAGTVFCLTEGPDKETCELVHRMAHGNIACALTEVEPGFYKTIMGEKFLLDEHMVRKTDGTVDQGYRFFLLISIRGIASAKSSRPHLLSIPSDVTDLVNSKIALNRGREVRRAGVDSIIGVFDDAGDALSCAVQLKIALDFRAEKSQIVYRGGLSADQPVTKDGEFFTRAIALAHTMSSTANDSEILVSPLARQLCSDQQLLNADQLRYIDLPAQQFLVRLFDLLMKRLPDDRFNIETLCKDIGLSRAQLYRKLTFLTGRAPNNFLRDLRLDKAFSMLRSREDNVTQIAYKVGFNSPSYFAKCFAGKYGRTPSELLTSA
jgi:AraC-like DNA-binding protein